MRDIGRGRLHRPAGRRDDGRPGPSTTREWIRSAVSRFEGPLTLYAARLLGDADRARDVVQDTFLKLCRQDSMIRDAVPDIPRRLLTVCRRALDNVPSEGGSAEPS